MLRAYNYVYCVLQYLSQPYCLLGIKENVKLENLCTKSARINRILVYSNTYGIVKYIIKGALAVNYFLRCLIGPSDIERYIIAKQLTVQRWIESFMT